VCTWFDRCIRRRGSRVRGLEPRPPL